MYATLAAPLARIQQVGVADELQTRRRKNECYNPDYRLPTAPSKLQPRAGRFANPSLQSYRAILGISSERQQSRRAGGSRHEDL